MTNYPETRKSPVRLTDEERYYIYKYCIENHSVYQIESAIEWRVNKERIAKEINMFNYPWLEGRKLSAYHIVDGVETVVDWQKKLGKLPVVPLETVELDQLKSTKIKMIKEIENYKLVIEKANNDIAALAIEVERLRKSDAQSKMDRIRAIVSC